MSRPQRISSSDNRSTVPSDAFATDFNSRAARTRLADSIQAVLRDHHEEKQSGKDVKQVPDDFGEAVTRVLNRTPAFRGSSSVQNCGEEAASASFLPLFSRRNLLALRQHLTWSFLIRLPIILLIRIWDACRFLTKNPKPLRSALVLFVFSMITSIALIVMVCHKIIIWLIRTVTVCLSMLVPILADVKDLQRLYPERVIWVYTKFAMLAKVINNSMLGCRKYAAREWNADAHLWKGSMEASSRKESLWKCPPPSAKHGRRRALDANRLPVEWSQETKQHVLGINFCYIMLREDYIRRQLKYRRMVKEKQNESNARRAAFARAKSMALDIPSLSQRGLVSTDREVDGMECPDEERHGGSLSTLVRPHSVMGELSAIELVGNSRQGVLSDRLATGICLESDDEEQDDATSSSSVGSSFALDDLSLVASPKRTRPSLSRDASIRSDESDIDLDWLDVGTRIGIRLLNSEHVQKAVASQETAERILDMSKKVESHLKKTSIDPKTALANADSKSVPLLHDGVSLDYDRETMGRLARSENLGVIVPPAKPLHSMWTSPAAAAARQSESSIGSMSDGDDDSLTNGQTLSPAKNCHRLQSPHEMRPPRSPHMRRGSKQTADRNGAFKTVVPKDDVDVLTQRRDVDDRVAVATPPHIKRFASESWNALDPREEKENESISRPRSFVREGVASPLEIDLVTSKSSPSALKPATGHPNASKQVTRRPNLQPGTKVVVPILPKQPGVKFYSSSRVNGSMFQMATVVKSKRVHLPTAGPRQRRDTAYTNCLSVTVKLDKSFLRGADFADMTFRVRDEWSSRYMPRHSKFPIGACVATSYGLGVLVGWRVEDDCHVIGSLWQHRGAGAAHAYLNRDSIQGVIEASVGFDVETNIGRGTVVAYTHGGKECRGGRFFVHVKEGRNKGQVLEFARNNILSCLGAKYIPVIELLREAAHYQLRVDRYAAALRQQSAIEKGEYQPSEEELLWQTCTKGLEILWTSFLKVVEEDKDFDQGLGHFVTNIIRFLESLDSPGELSKDAIGIEKRTTPPLEESEDRNSDIAAAESTVTSSMVGQTPAGFWFWNDLFGGIFQDSQSTVPSVTVSEVSSHASYVDEVEAAKSDEYYKYAFSFVQSLMRTVSLARTSCVDEPNLSLAFSICYEFLLFVKTVLKVQQKNVSPQSLRIWKHAMEEIAETLGPIKDRLQKIGNGLAERMEQHGRKAKVRILRFADLVLSDERLMAALERDDWETCIERVEEALVNSKIIDEASRVSIHKTIEFVYNNSSSSGNADVRYGEKLAQLAAAMQWLSSPRRALLTVLRSDPILDLMERLLVRVFRHDSFASRMLTIHASNFQTLRQLRMLKDFTIAGKLWIPILDAANDELHWAVSNMPDNARDLMVPISQLFSLCVSQFHRLGDGDLTADWLSFLMRDEAVDLIKEIDVKLILAVQALCNDIKEVMVVLPYYPSIDDDILNLIDEVDLEEFLKEAADVIEDAERLTDFIREKSTIAIERFLDWIPKMSIPVERRELGDGGWVLTCRGESGGDLTLSDVIIRRENLCCQVLGGETMFFPMFGQDNTDAESLGSALSSSVAHDVKDTDVIETSILDHIRDLLEKAQSEGYWQAGVGGVEKLPSDRYVASILGGMPVTDVLDSSIELWRSLELDDDELLEIVIREVSYQIQFYNEHRKEAIANGWTPKAVKSRTSRVSSKSPNLFGHHVSHHRFNPRMDPTVLYFEMKKLTLNLERFQFRIEKMHRLTIFDPVFEGEGSLHVRNISMRVRVECRKERTSKLGAYDTVPVLHLHELDISLEKVKFKVKDTGADWILNQAVKGFEDNITKAVEENLKDQVKDQIRTALEHLNSYFTVNPDLLLGLLGIAMEDLEENAVWV